MRIQRHSCFTQWIIMAALVGLVAFSISRAIADDCDHNGIPDEQDYASGVLHDVNPADGVPDECEGCPLGKLYTTTTDFQLGTLSDSIDTSVSGQLRLKAPPAMFPYVNVACSARGTVARINVNETDPAKAVVGEYATAPLKLNVTGIHYGLMNPSRTTVDHKGNIWVANRDEDSPSPPGSGPNMGSITRIALVLGGTRGNKDANGNFVATPDGSGQYIQNPTYTSVPFDELDRHGTTINDQPDGLIKTSNSLGNILDWMNGYPSIQHPDNDGGVSTADDECIATYTRVLALGTRTIAVDADNNVWVGGVGNGIHQKINGQTGLWMYDETQTPPVPIMVDMDCGGYGGLIDANGVLWSVNYNSLMRYEPANPSEAKCLSGSYYGISVDPVEGFIWVSNHGTGQACQLDPRTGQTASNGPSCHCYDQDWIAQGLAVDCNRHVWVVKRYLEGGNEVLHLAPIPGDSLGRYYEVGRINGAPGDPHPHDFSQATGAAVDVNGMIWVAEMSGWASMINPSGGPHNLDTDEPIGEVVRWVDLNREGLPSPGPYNYSDMSGFVSRVSSVGGKWNVIQDGGVYGGLWNHITWNTECPDPLPAGTSLIVQVRVADSPVGLTTAPYSPVENGIAFGPIRGRYIQVEVSFKASNPCSGTFQSPVLCDLAVGFAGSHNCNGNSVWDECELASGTASDCNGDGVLDSCEPDCDLSGRSDICEILEGTLTDCNGNFIPDKCEIDANPSLDANGNHILDACEGCPADWELLASRDDFSPGQKVNVHVVTPGGYLELNDPPPAHPYVNVACTDRGTVARIDINTGLVVGEYRTAPSSIPVANPSPSRTTVDHNGSVWVANRYDISKGRGSITRFAMLLGGTRCNANGDANSNGQYLKEPFGYCSVGEGPIGDWRLLDRHGATIYDLPDGLIKTSKGGYVDDTDNVLPWDDPCAVDAEGGVMTADDELIINYTRVEPPGTRALAVDANNDLWVGGTGGNDNPGDGRHQKISGLTGQPILDATGKPLVLDFNCGGYGALIDQNGVLWSARYNAGGYGLLRFDPALWPSPQASTCFQVENYGLALDPVTGWVWYSENNGTYVHALDSTGTEVFQKDINMSAKGLAVDCRGHVWIAETTTLPWYSGTRVVHLAPNPAPPTYYLVGVVGATDGTGGPFNGTTGVAVDSNGMVWVTEKGGHSVSRIDPTQGPLSQNGPDRVGAVMQVVDLGADGVAAGPYNYSDMAGTINRQASLHGTWTDLHDSGVYGAHWNTVSWNLPSGSCPSAEPPGTELSVRIRAADTQEGLASATYVPVPADKNNEPIYGVFGSWVQVEVHFKGHLECSNSWVTPRLCSLKIGSQQGLDLCPSLVGQQDACALNHNDCNRNALPDECDIASEFSNDRDGNGLPDECELVGVFAGTSAIGTAPARVLVHTGGVRLNDGRTWRDISPAPASGWNAKVVHALTEYRGYIYAGVETHGSPGTGEIWRYREQFGWTRLNRALTPPAGEFGDAVVAFGITQDRLYTVTRAGQVYRFVDDSHDWVLTADTLQAAQFTTGIVAPVCGYPDVFLLSKPSTRGVWRLSLGAGVEMLAQVDCPNTQEQSSPLSGFAELDGAIYACSSGSTGGLFQMTAASCALPTCTGLNGSSWFTALPESTGMSNRAIAAFRGKLFIGGGGAACGVPNGPSFCGTSGGARLWQYDLTWPQGARLGLLNTWPTVQNGVSVSALAANVRYLYIGLGLPEDTTTPAEYRLAEIWRYDGQQLVPISGPHTFDGGVQSILVRQGTQPDCDGDGYSDAYELAHGSGDCNQNGVPDECDLDTDGDTIPDACDPDDDDDGIPDTVDNCRLVANSNQLNCDGDEYGNACDPTHGSPLDYDRDCDVDQDDFAVMQNCFTGEGVSLDSLPNAQACRNAGVDVTGDNSVTMDDLELFIQCVSGPAVPANINCLEGGGGAAPPPDTDHDGIHDGIDNCPLVANAGQADTNSDGVGDACDADSDGIRNDVDNCASVANANQWDWDSDGLGNACDNCLLTANADQADPDSDGVGTACDNCPSVANPGQENSEIYPDSSGDACDDDDDNDGVLDTADNCPTVSNPDQTDSDSDGAGDACDTCPTVADPGQSNQDGDYWQDACDNCPTVLNYYQQDADGDHVGDACDNCPTVPNADQADTDQDGIGDACEGEGLLGGGELQMMMQMEGGESGPTSTTTASFVQHGTGAASVTLPPQGGTVVVDLVIATTDAIASFSLKPAASASDIIAIDATGWTDQANALFSLGYPGTSLPSYYRLDLLWWQVAFPSVQALSQTPRPTGTAAVTGTSLAQIAGPSAGEVFGFTDGLDALAGPIGVPATGVFTTATPMSGWLDRPVSNGTVTVATLTFQVVGAPGTYTLGVVEGTCSTENGEATMMTGTPFTIIVQGQ